jgi:hypothetical protein
MAKKNKRIIQSAPVSIASAPRPEFNPDYTTVKKDLRRIGLLAAVFIVGLVSLSFFLK